MELEFKNNNDFLTIFEKRLQEFTRAPYVVLTSSCTNAIMLMLKFKKSKKATLPKNTYVSVAQLLYREVQFEYIDNKWEETYHICDDIYDCAVGFKENMFIPGHYQCLSFQQKKTLNIGKGGAILLDSYDDYKILKRMAHDGRDDSIPTSEDIENIILGYHVYMSPDEASKGVLLLNQLAPKDFKMGSYKDYPDISKIKY